MEESWFLSSTIIFVALCYLMYEFKFSDPLGSSIVRFFYQTFNVEWYNQRSFVFFAIDNENLSLSNNTLITTLDPSQFTWTIEFRAFLFNVDLHFFSTPSVRLIYSFITWVSKRTFITEDYLLSRSRTAPEFLIEPSSRTNKIRSWEFLWLSSTKSCFIAIFLFTMVEKKENNPLSNEQFESSKLTRSGQIGPSCGYKLTPHLHCIQIQEMKWFRI